MDSVMQQFGSLAQSTQQQINEQKQQFASTMSNSNPTIASLHPSHAQPFSHVKPQKPNTFDGTRKTNANNWLLEMQIYFDITLMPNENKILFAATLLKESALQWYSSMKRTNSFDDWDDFVEKFKKQFEPVEVTKTARMQLYALHQKGPVAGYIDLFRKLKNLIDDMSDADTIFLFKKGLTPALQTAVSVHNPKTLEEMMNVAQRAELDSRATRPFSSAPSSFVSRSQSTTFSSNGTAPMDLSAAEQSNTTLTTEREHDEENKYGESESSLNAMNGPLNKLTDSERADLMKRGACFRCRQVGHLARNCNGRNNSTQSYPKNMQRKQ